MQQQSQQQEEVVENSEKCPVCLEVLINSQEDSDIHNGRCGHSIHLKCLQSLLRAGNYSCSICRMPFGEVHLQPNQSHLKRYAKMLQQKLPIAAVRQRMEADRVAPDVIDSFFTGGVSLIFKDEEEFSSKSGMNPIDSQKYLKMLKIGMAEEAVRQRMESVGISSEDIDGFFRDFYEHLT